MSEKLKLTKRQGLFLCQMLEIDVPERAAERFMEIMVEERVSPLLITKFLDKIMKKMGV